jgi:TRAP-type C4-dicarboxylate transport system permease small subunit
MKEEFINKLAQLIDSSKLELPNKVNDGAALSSKIQIVVQIVIVTMGAISVLIIVIAGFQYVMSSGDPQKIAKAKDAIIYAVIGLVIAIFAFTIVGFIAGRIF